MTQSRTSLSQNTRGGVRLPNFLIIGAGKSGTTSISQYLSEHPEIYVSPFKEPMFFSYEDTSVEGYMGEWIAHNYQSNGIGFQNPYRLETYTKLFENVTNEKAVGEASTHYLCQPRAIERIKHHIPHVKLIAVLRHPVERAYSQFAMNRSRNFGQEEISSFEKAVAAESSRLSWPPDFHYVRVGLYHEQLKRYFQNFARDQIKIYLFEDLKKHPETLLDDLFTFLEVDSNFMPDMGAKHNVGSYQATQNRSIRSFIEKPHPIKSALKRLIPQSLHQRLHRQLISAERSANTVPIATLSQQTYLRLLPAFTDDIIKLQDLIGRDLSHWLELPKKERSG